MTYFVSADTSGVDLPLTLDDAEFIVEGNVEDSSIAYYVKPIFTDGASCSGALNYELVSEDAELDSWTPLSDGKVGARLTGQQELTLRRTVDGTPVGKVSNVLTKNF